MRFHTLKLLTLLCAGLATSITAPAFAGRSVQSGEKLIPGIWIDPDGCEHWAMDDGWEGYMSPVVLPDGTPVCGRKSSDYPTCGYVASDRFFATGSAAISEEMRDLIEEFFRDNRRHTFLIEGHTDSRGSNAYNMDLSIRRANAVAEIGRAMGARISAVKGLGETDPRATNRNAAGMEMNRRVEIKCVR